MDCPDYPTGSREPKPARTLIPHDRRHRATSLAMDADSGGPCLTIPDYQGAETVMLKKVLAVLFIGGLLLTGCGAPGNKGTVEVPITLTEFEIQSPRVEFETGTNYHFVVTNAGSVEHEFMLMAPLTKDHMGMAMDMETMDAMALAMIHSSDLPAGATASVEYTFTKPAPAGQLEFACHTPGHYEADMRLPIVVK